MIIFNCFCETWVHVDYPSILIIECLNMYIASQVLISGLFWKALTYTCFTLHNTITV